MPHVMDGSNPCGKLPSKDDPNFEEELQYQLDTLWAYVKGVPTGPGGGAGGEEG